MAGTAIAQAVLAGPAFAGERATAVARTMAGAASARASAFQVTIAGRTLAGGVSAASISAAGVASATGDGAVEGVPSVQGVQDPVAVAPSNATAARGHQAAQAQPCGFRTPAPASAVAPAAVSCSSASATSTASKAAASASGRLDGSSVNLGSALGSVPVVGQPAASALRAALGQVVGALPASGRAPLASLLPAVKAATSLAVTAMPSTSSVAWNGSSGSAVATTGVAQVALLPGAGRSGGPLATVDIGQSRASAAYGAAGTSPLSLEAAPVTVEISPPALPAQSVSLVPGQTYTLFQGTPLQTTIAVGMTSASTAPDGTETGTASAVDIHALSGLDGGVQLGFSGLTVAAAPPAAVPAAPPATAPPGAAPPAAPPGVPGATIVHTGLPWAGALGPLGGAGLAGAALVLWSYRRPRSRRRAASKAAAWPCGRT